MVETGKIFVFVNLGYSRLDEAVANLHESATNSTNGISGISGSLAQIRDTTHAWSVDQQSGKVNINFFGSLNLNGNEIINVSKILGMDGKWSLDENGKLIVKEIETEKLKVTSPGGFTIFDEDTRQPVCVKSKNLALTVMAGECGANISGEISTSTSQ